MRSHRRCRHRTAECCGCWTGLESSSNLLCSGRESDKYPYLILSSRTSDPNQPNQVQHLPLKVRVGRSPESYITGHLTDFVPLRNIDKWTWSAQTIEGAASGLRLTLFTSQVQPTTDDAFGQVESAAWSKYWISFISIFFVDLQKICSTTQSTEWGVTSKSLRDGLESAGV
jgi:hypothetical protein